MKKTKENQTRTIKMAKYPIVLQIEKADKAIMAEGVNTLLDIYIGILQGR